MTWPARRISLRRPGTLLAAVTASAALAVTVAPAHAAPSAASGSAGTAVQAAYEPSAADLRIQEKLSARATSTRFGTYFSGIVLDAESDEVVWARKPDVLRRPASNVKLVTAVNALQTFGSPRRFTTRVRQGKYPRHVILVGEGDPSLTSGRLKSLAKATAADAKARGVKSLRVYVDDDVFPRTFTSTTGWLASYVPESMTPLRGLVRDQRDVLDTSKDAAIYFRNRLRDYGVDATYKGYGQSYASRREIAAVTTYTVGTSTKRMLLNSDNEVAEALHRLVGISHGEGNTWEGARRAQAEAIVDEGLETGPLYDGSGLSRSNRLSVLQLARIMDRGLDTRYKSLWPLRSPLAMPTAGQTGTLQAAYGRFTTSSSKCAVGKVWAKTGTLSDVVALTGYTQGADGRTKVFSFIVNGKSSTLTLKQNIDMLAATVNGCY